MKKETASGRPAVEPQDSPVPNTATRPDGQHVDHWVLSAEERAKGHVRPVREWYKHVGPVGPKYPTRPLTADEISRFGDDYAVFEEYPAGQAASGSFWTQAQLDAVGKGCEVETKMPRACAETYAREPGFYGQTFCCGCNKYLAVDEFAWLDDGTRVGT